MPDSFTAKVDFDARVSRTRRILINDSLLNIDHWFTLYGDQIAPEPRAELEGYFLKLSTEIAGFAGKPVTFDLPSEGDDGPDVAFGQSVAEGYDASLLLASAGALAGQGVPVYSFGRDAELHQRAQARRDAASAGTVAMVIIWAILAIGLAVWFFASKAKAENAAHMAQYHATDEMDEYFSNLKSPGGGSCCDKEDCKRVDAKWRHHPNGEWGWWALVPTVKGPKWMPVPAALTLKVPSIDGDAYACASEGSEGGPAYIPGGGGPIYIGPTDPVIYCFVPPDTGN